MSTGTCSRNAEIPTTLARFEPAAVPAKPVRAQLFSYAPTYLTGYRWDHIFETSIEDSFLSQSIHRVTLIFKSVHAGRREAYLRDLYSSTAMGGKRRIIRLRDGLVEVRDGEEITVFQRGADPFGVTAFTNKPLFTVSVNRHDVGIPEIAMSAIGGVASASPLVQLVFPDLPSRAILPGFQWTSSTSSSIKPSPSQQPLNAYSLRYLGDAACPHVPKSQCAQFNVTANGKGYVEATQYAISYAGRLFFDMRRHRVHEVRLASIVTIRLPDRTVQSKGTLRISAWP